ncbi:MAG: hypothetical protein AVDCRST_MAG19-4179 [uncultured Thermomicrobiales bacterium]|uniref:Uncharacterized protein n=1 Tax=uncultured Thermomicrobiales bacterium TaxID=1645740 RepID=A0A6J4VQN0_9BACT|nr:MAG: hypothetical protein AVDCRST_MAG19-4179 [uncultured Thermomicrobiales bacterium]
MGPGRLHSGTPGGGPGGQRPGQRPPGPPSGGRIGGRALPGPGRSGILRTGTTVRPRPRRRAACALCNGRLAGQTAPHLVPRKGVPLDAGSPYPSTTETRPDSPVPQPRPA